MKKMTCWLNALTRFADQVYAVAPLPGSKHPGIEATLEKKLFEDVVSETLNLKTLRTVQTGWDPVPRHP